MRYAWSSLQTATVIPANLAAAHVGEYVTVEGVVADDPSIGGQSGNHY